ncbi:hypothetical protein Q5N34_18170 [Vibrio cholerae]|nr:hypothetical protein [Vibrio cholerae]MCD6678914.1 hypothetical protein [Vibrio cholerae]MDS1873206.1 hypothetical protein [Vibrio vulnificus]MDV2319241.1 hypothetical protein [Vibrio cholerae]
MNALSLVWILQWST